MTEIDFLEIRLLFLGDPFVGKKSIVNRFKILNANQTLNNKEAKINQTNTSKTESIFYNTQDIKQKLAEKVKIEELTNFTKIWNISNYSINLKTFIIPPATPIKYNDNLNEEEETERNHKLKFDETRNEIEKILTKTSPVEVKHVFCFVYDSGSTETFEKATIYFEEVEKYFNITKNHLSCFISNKVDQKTLWNDQEKLNWTTFFTEFPIKHYEISTKMFFNFEKLFHKIFIEIFGEINKDFITPYFQERLQQALFNRATFPKSKRQTFTFNDTPGPQQYTSNVYDISQSENIKSIFANKERFKKKIFVNKQGPVFNYKKEGYSNNTEKKKKIEEQPKNKKKEKEEEHYYKPAYNSNEQQFTSEISYPYSMANKVSTLNIKKQRKEQYKEYLKEIENIFELDNILCGNRKRDKRFQSSVSLANVPKLKKQKSKRKKVIIKEDPNRSLELLQEFNEKQKIYEERKNDYVSRRVETLRNKSVNYRAKPIEPIITPGPNAYDIRGKIDTNKGFSFGVKLKNHFETALPSIGPQGVDIKTDFDEVVKKPKFGYSLALRFKENIELSETKNNEEFNRNMEEFSKRKKDNLVKKINKILENREKFKAEKIDKNDNTPGPAYYKINYNQVEENAPLYSIKGRIERIENKEEIDNNNSINGNETSLSFISKNINKSLNTPNVNFIKPSAQAFSFPHADRFIEGKLEEMPGPGAYYKIESPDRNDDKEKVYYFSKGNRFYYRGKEPTPGFYKLPGFTDELLLKLEKKNRNRSNSQKSFENESQ